MNQPVYKTFYSDKDDYFVFESAGKSGIVLKVVKFVEIEDNLFNLGFGDYNPLNGFISDTENTNNGDMEKVLATIVSLIVLFLKENPLATITFEGSTKSRTRLYQMAINHFYDSFIEMFEIYGINADVSSNFEKNKSYESFLIRKLL